MQLTFKPARLTGFAILAVAAATALSVGACSHNDKSADKSPAKSSPASATGKDTVFGVVASVSGDTVEVTAAKGTAKVDVSSSTKVSEFSQAQLSDITPGSCVTVVSTPAPAPGGAATAKTVQLGEPGAGGKCAQPKNAAQPPNLIGTVASVAGNTINVTVTGADGNPSEIPVTIADTTRYSKHVFATSQAIAQGKCLSAWGTRDSGGTLQATIVGLGPANDGHCAH